MKNIILVILFLGLNGCSKNYSDGFRIGTIRKFSKKGVFIKSWEGELLLGGIVSTGGKNPELVNEIFEFSVDPEAQHSEDIPKIVEQINDAVESDQRTKIYYIQNTVPKIRTCTEYFVQRVEKLK